MYKLLSTSIVIAVMASSVLFSVSAVAGPSTCSANSFTLDGKGYDECIDWEHFKTFDKPREENFVENGFGGDWTKVKKSDNGVTKTFNKKIEGVKFKEIYGENATKNGDWHLKYQNKSSDIIYLDLAFLIKAGKEISAFKFKGVKFSETTGSILNTLSGKFNIDNHLHDLSHLTLFARISTTSVPEPASIFLTSLGLISFGFARRQRQSAFKA